MDLVAGATGFVGSRIARRLRAEGRSVRALVRGGAWNPHVKERLNNGIEIVDGDVRRPETLDAACQGIHSVVCTITSMPDNADDGLRRVDHDGVLALIDAAERAGVKRFIYTSYSGNIRAQSPLETAKRECEARLLVGAAKMYPVILRPSYLMETWLSPMLGFDPLGATARIYGGGESRVQYISAYDVAEFGLAAVATSDVPKVLELGGPEALSQFDAVRIFEETLGIKMAIETMPLSLLEARHSSITDPLHKTFAALTLCYAKGDSIPASLETAHRLGVHLRSVRDYARSFQFARPAGVA